ncbi:MAG TPA: UbiD family decarboxylase, partial [Burkholderiales bacterium]|nr:UbiD family decarboxylase [Burkholderiales bacterium]
MNESFREFLERLRQERELIDLKQAVDIRHIATLVDQSEHALFFHNVIGYELPVVSGIIRTERRAALSMGCGKYSEIEAKLRRGIDHPIAPRQRATAPNKEVIRLGDDVDLFKLPIP